MDNEKAVMVTNADREILMNQTLNTLFEWRYLLNRWEWPEELPNEETRKNWVFGGRREQLGCWIDKHCNGRYGSLHYSNVTRSKRMTEEEFDLFYSGAFLGHNENYKKFSYISWKKIEDNGSPPPEGRFIFYHFIWRILSMFDLKTARKFTEWSFGTT